MLSCWKSHPDRLHPIRWFHTAAYHWRWSRVRRSRPACQWLGQCRRYPLLPWAGWYWRQLELLVCALSRTWAFPGLRADTRPSLRGPRRCWTWTTLPQSSRSCGLSGWRWKSISHSLVLWNTLRGGIDTDQEVNGIYLLLRAWILVCWVTFMTLGSMIPI